MPLKNNSNFHTVPSGTALNMTHSLWSFEIYKKFCFVIIINCYMQIMQIFCMFGFFIDLTWHILRLMCPCAHRRAKCYGCCQTALTSIMIGAFESLWGVKLLFPVLQMFDNKLRTCVLVPTVFRCNCTRHRQSSEMVGGATFADSTECRWSCRWFWYLRWDSVICTWLLWWKGLWASVWRSLQEPFEQRTCQCVLPKVPETIFKIQPVRDYFLRLFFGRGFQ